MRAECGRSCALKMLPRWPVRTTASQTKGYSVVVFAVSIRQMRTLRGDVSSKRDGGGQYVRCIVASA